MSPPYSVHRPSKNRGDAVRLFCISDAKGPAWTPALSAAPGKRCGNVLRHYLLLVAVPFGRG